MVADLLLEALPEKKKYISCRRKLDLKRRKLGISPIFPSSKAARQIGSLAKESVEVSLIFLVNGR